jgi:peptidoglycan-associated lipoprotein
MKPSAAMSIARRKVVPQRLRSPRCLLAAALASAIVTGCATTQSQTPDTAPSAAELDAMTRTSGGEISTKPLAMEPLSPLDDPSSPLYRKVVYFDYDTAEIQPQYLDLLRAHANYLYRTPGAAVTLEGNTDERGTRDYNLALSDSRAGAVKRFMIAEGVPADKLTTLGYGEERPADPGHNQQSWALNRRVELVY